MPSKLATPADDGIYTPNLGSETAVQEWEREQRRFGGSSGGALRPSKRGAQQERRDLPLLRA